MAASFNDPRVQNAILGDVQAINELLGYLAQLNPSKGEDYPAGSIRLQETDTTNHYYALQVYNGTSWTTIARLLNDANTLRGYAPSTSAAAGTIPVYNASGQLVGNISGNAASSTKLATARKIQVGGIASSTAQDFNGTADVNIPINQITLNNEADNAVNGVLTKAHGGTGRTDGAAVNFVFTGISGELKATAVGQLGQAANRGDVDMDTLVEQGAYGVQTVSGQAKHQPYANNVAFIAPVWRNGAMIFQLMLQPKYNEIWMRRSLDSGASWSGWQCVSGNAVNATFYVSKSGSDLNTGLESAYPVQTIARAMEIASGYIKAGLSSYINLRLGSGDWGALGFEERPFAVHIQPYDGGTPTEYSADLPVINLITAQWGARLYLRGVVITKYLLASYGGNVYVEQGYKRVARISASQNAVISFQSQNATTNLLEFAQEPGVTTGSCLAATQGGRLIFGDIHVRLAENITNNVFMSASAGGSITLPASNFKVDSSSYTFTGKKIVFYKTSEIITGEAGPYPSLTSGLPAIFNTLPGTQAGSVEIGTVINGCPVGFGAADDYVAKTGDTMSGPLKSTLAGGSWLNAFKGNSLIAQITNPGNANTLYPLFRVPTGTGVFVGAAYTNAFRLAFALNNMISSNTNGITHSIDLLNDAGQTRLKELIVSSSITATNDITTSNNLIAKGYARVEAAVPTYYSKATGLSRDVKPAANSWIDIHILWDKDNNPFGGVEFFQYANGTNGAILYAHKNVNNSVFTGLLQVGVSGDGKPFADAPYPESDTTPTGQGSIATVPWVKDNLNTATNIKLLGTRSTTGTLSVNASAVNKFIVAEFQLNTGNNAIGSCVVRHPVSAGYNYTLGQNGANSLVFTCRNATLVSLNIISISNGILAVYEV